MPLTLRTPQLKTAQACHLRQELHADGFRSLAVVLKHAAIFPDNEKAVGQVARELGFTQVGRAPSTQVVDCIKNQGGQAEPLATQVSLSHEVMQMVKMVPRGFTATADAYLTPHIMRCAVGMPGHWYGHLVGNGTIKCPRLPLVLKQASAARHSIS